MDFATQAWPILEPATPFKSNWHLGCIAEHLEAVTALQIKRLVINMPPRHMKSLLACVFWFCWVWTKYPESRWLYSSHKESLAIRDSVKCRDLIFSDWYQRRWGHVWQVKEDVNNKVRFENNKGGMRLSFSVGGGTGEGGNYIVTDDPHQIDQAESEAMNEAVHNWWDGTMSTRGNDPATTRHVIVMQKLGDRDLSAHVQRKRELGYETLCLPCHYDPKRIIFQLPADPKEAEQARLAQPDAIVLTPLQRDREELRDPRTEEGQLLWPEHFGTEQVRDLELRLGPWGAAAQLDQKAVPEGHGIFQKENFLYFQEEFYSLNGEQVRIFRLRRRDGSERLVFGHHCLWFQTVDTAMGTSEQNDYTVVGTFAVTPDRDLLVYEIARLRLAVPVQLGFLLGQRLKYPQLVYQAIENAQSGYGLIQAAMLQGTPFRILKAGNKANAKVQRCAASATMYQNGQVYHHGNQPWLLTFEAELIAFDNGEHDDQVDVVAYAGLQATTDQLLGLQKQGSLVLYPRAEDLVVGSSQTLALPYLPGNIEQQRRGRVREVLESDWDDAPGLSVLDLFD